MTLRVLAVMPTVEGLPALGWADELLHLVETPGVQLTPLPGGVTRRELSIWLRSWRWDLLLWPGHGRAGQLLLAHETVEARWLASQVRRRVRLAVLSVCESSATPAAGLTSFAEELPAAGVALVAMSTAVEDPAAARFDVALVQALAAGSPAMRAVQVAREAISGTATARAVQYFEAVRIMPEYGDYGQPMDTQRLVYDLVGRMGVVETRVGNIAEDVSEMRSEMREIRKDIQALAPAAPVRQPVSLPREAVLFASAGAVVMLAILIYIVWLLV